MSEGLSGFTFPSTHLRRQNHQALVPSSSNVMLATSRSPSTVMTFPTSNSRLRRRQPTEHMKRACSLLACGWSFQSWGTDGFASVLGGSCLAAPAVGWLVSCGGGIASQLSIMSTRGSCPIPPTRSWQKRPHQRPLSSTREDGVAPHRVKVSPILDVQEGGGVVIGESSPIESSPNGVEDGSSNGKRRPKTNNSAPRSDRILELLNGLEGGGGFDDDANEFFTAGFERDVGTIDEYEEDEEDGISLEERGEDDDDEEVDGGIIDTHHGMPSKRENAVVLLRPKSARRFRRRIHRRQAPLTRSQVEEETLYPTVKLIQELTLNKDSEDSIEEVLKIMDEIKEEHQEKGLGLAHVYKAGMTACADFGRHRETLRLFHELRAFKDSPPRRQSYDLAIVAHCLLRERDEAVATLREMKVAGYEPTEQTYNFVLRACRGSEGGVEVAEEVTKLYAEEEGLRAEDALPLNLELCRSYLLVLASGSEWEKALEIFWKLVAVGGRGKGYQKLPELDAGCCEATLVACRRAGKWREALQVFRHVRREDVEVELTSAMYTSTVMTLLLDEEEDTDVAVRVAASLYDEMRQLEYFGRLRPSVAASLLHALFAAYTRWEDHWPRAVETFETMKELDEEMEDEAFMPTANHYRSMLHILSQSKEVERGANWERSVEVLREAQALDLRLTEVSFNTVIADLGFAEEVDLAFEIHDEMRKAGIPPSTNTYNRLLGVCEKNGQVERAFEVLDEMYKSNLPPNVVSFGSAISACGKGYEWRKALALLVRMQHDNVSPNLHCMNAAINALGLSGEWQRAEQIMEVARQWGMVPNVISYNSLAMAYTSAGESERALGILDLMRENNVEPDEITFGTLLMACDGGDTYSSIKSLMDEMENLGIDKTVIHYCAAIESSNRVKETATSWELWRQMKLNGVEPNNHAYSSVINTAAIDRDVRTALRLLEEMEKKEMAIDVVTYTTAICACGPDWLLALDVFEDMVVDGVQPNLQAYTAVMCCCLAGEEYREAIHVFNRMKKAGITPDLRAYKLAIIALEKNGDVSGRWAMEAEIANSNIERYERDWDARW